MKLSIIIPYYKTYELTYKLLRELTLQIESYEVGSVEVILIDDGCNERRFDRFDWIKVIHQENQGVAKTRNKGIELAKGKYVAFIDCDDMITMDYVDTLMKAIEDYDTEVINFNWADFNKNEIYRKPKNFAPWKAIYKKSTMPIFLEGKKFGSEDVWFQAEIDKKTSITYLDRVLYIYNSNREGSLMWEKMHGKE